jgi:hypothetical protein
MAHFAKIGGLGQDVRRDETHAGAQAIEGGIKDWAAFDEGQEDGGRRVPR